MRSSRARSPSLQMPFTKTKSKALFLGRELSRHQQAIDNSRRFDTMQLESFSIHHAHWMVGKAYTAQLGLKPGDEFEIKLGRKQIQLIPLGAADEE